ncbi:hypothetical protein PR001_g27177 [Phytophthora rubi]|uniref:Expansin-like EG45 domain-containing protein n=1 Tax=Phytophthora rubi TaxID=129364 RepID=A0A6A3HQ06_9STRA|nr:hypothetical protein PR001_g27177 [Phytophthora rubi]
MRSQQVVSVLLLAGRLSSAWASTTYEGYGTVYTLSAQSDGNCNFMSWPDAAVTKYAALNAEQWEETMNCGRCAQVSCTDASCAGQSSEIVYIMDQCPGCAYGDLDLSPDVFESITGQSYTKLSIEWELVDCPVSNNVQYCLKTGSSEFWVAVQPANFVSGVQSLSINGQETALIDSAYYFLIDGSGESVADLNSVSISLTGVNGEVLEETVSLSADACTTSNSQFSSSGDVSQTTTTTSQTSTTSAPTPTTPTPTTPTPTTPTPTTPTPTTAAPTEAPTEAPVMEAPTTAPVTEAPTTAPGTTTAPVTEAPVTDAPTTAPVTEAPTTAPATEAPATQAPTTAPVTKAPETEAPTTAPVTEVPTSQPTTAPPTPTPTSTPIQKLSTAQSASDATLTHSSSTDQESSVLTTSTKAVSVASTNSTSSNVEQESESASVGNEEQSATKATPSTQTSTTVQSETSTPTPTSTPSATEASVQEEASSSGGLHSTAAIVGLIAAVCVALGDVVGVVMAVHKKRKLLEASKTAEDRDSMASYVSVRTPRSDVPVLHSAV